MEIKMDYDRTLEEIKVRERLYKNFCDDIEDFAEWLLSQNDELNEEYVEAKELIQKMQNIVEQKEEDFGIDYNEFVLANDKMKKYYFAIGAAFSDSDLLKFVSNPNCPNDYEIISKY